LVWQHKQENFVIQDSLILKEYKIDTLKERDLTERELTEQERSQEDF